MGIFQSIQEMEIENENEKTKCLIDFKPYKFYPARSSSASDIWVFKSNSGDIVFLKIFPTDFRSSGLLYESGVYRYINEKLKQPNMEEYSDNFVKLKCILEGISFDDLFSLISKEKGIDRDNLIRNLKYILCADNIKKRPSLDSIDKDNLEIKGCEPDVKPENYNYSVIVTYAPSTDLKNIQSLLDFMEFDSSSSVDKYSVIARTALSICAMHRMGISHNDQHWGNILVSTDIEKSYIYHHNGLRYEFLSCYHPVLFDWDRSQIQNGEDNYELELYPGIYDSGNFKPGRDYLMFAKDLYRYKILSTLQLFAIFVSNPTPYSKILFTGFLHSKFTHVLMDKTVSDIEEVATLSFDVELLLQHLATKEHNIYTSTKQVQYSKKGDIIETQKPHGSWRCSYIKQNGDICRNKVKMEQISCWKHHR